MMHLARHLSSASLLASLALLTTAPALAEEEPKIQSYVLDGEIKLLSDRRNRGTSDTFNKPGIELNLDAAHESGLVGILHLGTVRKEIFPNTNGLQILGAVGYRWGKPEAWHFGLGLAQEWFPSGKLDNLPSGIDWASASPTGLANTRFDTSYAVVEMAYGIVEARYLYVLSKDLRGNNTATICGSLYLPAVLAGGDPSQAIACYAPGMRHSGGSQLLDVDIKYKLNSQTKLIAHLGYQNMRNFSGADIVDYKLGVVHTRFGLDWGLELIGAELRNPDYGVAFDSAGKTRRIDRTRLIFSVAKRF